MIAFAGGDADAFEVLVQRHQRAVLNFVYRSVRDRARAEELLQEIFLRVVRARARYSQTAKFTTWLYTIARNLCVDESRRAVHRRTVSLDAPRGNTMGGDTRNLLDTTAAHQPSLDEVARGPYRQQRIAAAIENLPVEQSEVFLLRQLQGMSFKDIAGIVGVTENTVKSRMRYALEKIRVELSDLDPRVPDGDTQAATAGTTGLSTSRSTSSCSPTASPRGVHGDG